MGFQARENLNNAAKVSDAPVRFAENESAIIAAAKNGQIASFELLIARYEQKILLRAMRITRNWQDAEDVKQQCVLKAFTRLHSFQGKSSFSTWLVRIAINEALMLLRKKRNWHEVPMETACEPDGEVQAPQIIPSNQLPDELCLAEERKQLLDAALQELTPAMRMAIQLRELEERSTQETARILGISIGATKSRVFLGRRKLREVLNRNPRTRSMSRRHLRRKIRNSKRARIVENGYGGMQRDPLGKPLPHHEGPFPFPFGMRIENPNNSLEGRI